MTYPSNKGPCFAGMDLPRKGILLFAVWRLAQSDGEQGVVHGHASRIAVSALYPEVLLQSLLGAPGAHFLHRVRVPIRL